MKFEVERKMDHPEGYKYVDCGLDNVIIAGVQLLVDDAGEEVVSIPNVNGLHKAIALGIVRRKALMSGRELRFLRTEMGMTQAEVAAMVHREPLAVSRWERNENPIDPNAETIIRLHAIKQLKLPIEASVSEISGWSIPRAVAEAIQIDGSDPAHYTVLEAA
jgi:transcriptional regulator with XRE-family HTH domain